MKLVLHKKLEYCSSQQKDDLSVAIIKSVIDLRCNIIYKILVIGCVISEVMQIDVKCLRLILLFNL